MVAPAAFASAAALRQQLQTELSVAPRPHLHVLGIHREAGEGGASVTDFDVWLDCCENASLQYFQLGEDGERLEASATQDEVAAWYETVVSELLSDPELAGVRVVKRTTTPDIMRMQAVVEGIARGVLYAGHVTTSSQVAGQEIVILKSPTQPPSTMVVPAGDMAVSNTPRMPTLIATWTLQWPFSDTTAINLSQPQRLEATAWRRRLKEAIVDKVNSGAVLRRDDTVQQVGRSPLRRAMHAQAQGRVVSTVQSGDTSTRRVVRMTAWGGDQN